MRGGLMAAVALAAAVPLPAATYLSQEQALRAAFPPEADVRRETLFLRPEQLRSASRLAGEEVKDELLIRYAGRKDGRLLGYAYFDSHRVRTLNETLMLVVSADGRLERIEVLSFLEPEDYLPRRRWLDQMNGRRLDGELSLHRAVRPISGASLTARAVVRASRKVLALHQAVAVPAP